MVCISVGRVWRRQPVAAGTKKESLKFVLNERRETKRKASIFRKEKVGAGAGRE
jgi:hypothetical protein